MVKRLLSLLLFASIACQVTQAQELNARVTVNSEKIQGTSKEVFTSLEKALTEFINNKKWTDATIAVNERIDCTFTIILNEFTENSYKGEIQIQARRPVYNSSYSTTLLNFRDRQLDFEYTQFEPLEYAETSISNNLVATVVFYIYTVLGLDFDSFSPQGGGAYHERAMQIVNMAQSQGSWTGWKAFDGNQNRHALATALTDNTGTLFRDLWYTYHLKGLDEMAANPDRGRTNIIAALPILDQIRSTRPVSVLLLLFSDAKLDEVVSIYSKATTQEKQEGLKLLSNLYPTQATRLEPLKK